MALRGCISASGIYDVKSCIIRNDVVVYTKCNGKIIGIFLRRCIMSKAIAWCKIQQWYDSETPESDTIYLMHEHGDDPNHDGYIWVHSGAQIFEPCLKALANKQNDFYVNGSYCVILKHRIFDYEYVEQFKSVEHIYSLASDTIQVYVYGRYNRCSIQKHDVVPIVANVETIHSHRKVPVNICKCNTCEPTRYFIGITSLKMYQKKYGVLLFNYIPDKSCFDEYGRSESSKLALYGYNVRLNGLSISERHSLLIWLLETEHMSYTEIKDHLEYLISQGQYNPKHQNALIEWEHDLEFISNYAKNGNTIYNGILCR